MTSQPPLAELINKSFQIGIFPDIYKIVKIIPIFKFLKVGHQYSAITIDQYLCSQALANYRRINAQTSLQLFRTTKLLYNAQFDFCLSLSTNNVLMSITENIQFQLDQNKFCAGVFVDLKKAFDTVDHEIL